MGNHEKGYGMDWREVEAALRVEDERCALCGLTWRGKGTLCAKCRLVAGLGAEQWGWCRARHRLATTQKDSMGQWACLAHGGGRS